MLDEQGLRSLVQGVVQGETTLDDLISELKDLPYKDLGDTLIDSHRALRTGIPEVVWGSHKTPEQVARIVGELSTGNTPVLVTRLTQEKYEEARDSHGMNSGIYDEVSRTFRIVPSREVSVRSGKVLIVTAGTSDLSVATEAKVTAELLGHEVEMLFDVGVAGLHRILGARKRLDEADIVIVVAGMDAALPSVIGGLTPRPVIAVPTSVGYGTAFGGWTALLSMLNACSAGITVVNIDNGFGAAVAASRAIAR